MLNTGVKMGELKNNTGRAWPVRDRRSDRTPDFSGVTLIDGKQYNVVVWENFASASNSRTLNMNFERVGTDTPGSDPRI